MEKKYAAIAQSVERILGKDEVASSNQAISSMSSEGRCFNGSRGFFVPIFQRSYYDHVIRNQQDYDEIWQYIENNPRKWLIEKRGYE